MNKFFVDYFDQSKLRTVPVRDGIPRFTPDISYSTGNFSQLREKHATLQLDSVNGTNDRYNTLLRRTGWPPEFFPGKVILECGCGAGPDTEVLLKLGAKVIAVDLAGTDVAKTNLGDSPNYQLVQADIANLPLKPGSFDMVFCHRVLQHTPDPKRTLAHLLTFVKPTGAVFVHSYANTFFQRFRWKYFLLPLTRRLDPERLYNVIKRSARPLFFITNFMMKFGKIGEYFNWVFIPFLNYRHFRKFEGKSDDFIIEYGIHDTFDALSPRFDRPISAKDMRRIAMQMLPNTRFEVITVGRTITLLRTLLT